MPAVVTALDVAVVTIEDAALDTVVSTNSVELDDASARVVVVVTGSKTS